MKSFSNDSQRQCLKHSLSSISITKTLCMGLNLKVLRLPFRDGFCSYIKIMCYFPKLRNVDGS